MEQGKQLIEQRKRKFLVMLPVLTIPFTILLFYSLGGGKGDHNTNLPRSSALSTTLPDPLLDEGQPMDKLSLYEQAAKDSEEQRKNDANDPLGEWMPADTANMLPPAPKSPFSYSPTDPFETPAPSIQLLQKKTSEIELQQKIAQLEKALQSPDVTAKTDTAPVALSPADVSPELQRLETIMQSVSNKSNTPDPELAQAESLMERILDVQHPERIRQRIREQSLENKKTIYPVSTIPVKEVSDLLGDSIPYQPIFASPVNRFYDEDPEPIIEQNALLASVRETQVLVSNATISLRLEQDAYVQGQLIPKGSSIFGIGTLNGERLEVIIHSIQKGNSIYPVSLIAYDMDGIAGIRIPGSIGRDVSKENSERAMQTFSMGTLDPSIGRQAAAAGIEAAKNLLSKKVKLIKVTVKGGYPLLLAPDKSNF